MQALLRPCSKRNWSSGNSVAMSLSKLQGVKLPASADFHVHLRDGPMMDLVVPTIRQGGVNTVYVMVRI